MPQFMLESGPWNAPISAGEALRVSDLRVRRGLGLATTTGPNGGNGTATAPASQPVTSTIKWQQGTSAPTEAEVTAVIAALNGVSLYAGSQTMITADEALRWAVDYILRKRPPSDVKVPAFDTSKPYDPFAGNIRFATRTYTKDDQFKWKVCEIIAAARFASIRSHSDIKDIDWGGYWNAEGKENIQRNFQPDKAKVDAILKKLMGI